ncbi:peroxisomal membrane anchor protein conserved region-domain-containing protein [Xylaria palmicola]|nr:peroxisomal membrane anchor protein conserved region-domain-containing protein [Xylaria palmicola]
MGDSEKPSIPAWQQGNADAAAEPENTTLDNARRFLDDERVKGATPEEKRTFLQGKGLDDAQITLLLEESPRDEKPSSVPQSASEPLATPDNGEHRTDTDSPPPVSDEAASTPAYSSPPPTAYATPESASSAAAAASPPPIITYPEFLTKPQRPPPLITPSRLANILTVAGGAWALLYGVAGLVVRPMADNLNGARAEYYDHVGGQLTRLVGRLEGAASEVPYKTGKPLKSQLHEQADDDDESVTSDPTELFHRDVGTQTSAPPSVIDAIDAAAASSSSPSGGSEKAVDVQARRLAAIGASLRELTLLRTQGAEGIADLRFAAAEVREEADRLAYPIVHDTSAMTSSFGSFGYYGSSSSGYYGSSSSGSSQSLAAHNDEFKRTREAILGVKGLFLSSRSFPAVAAR